MKRHHYRIPVAEELSARLSGCTVFSVLDAKSAFWQLALDERSSYLCTFATPWGRYRFLRVPFGLNIAPELFQQAIDSIFERQALVTPYFDDILFASRTLDEHVVHLRKGNFPERLRQHRNDVRKFDRQRSALAEHSEVNDHRITFDNSRVVDCEVNYHKRLFVESWHIQATPGNVNRSAGALLSVYFNGLRHVNKTKRDPPT